jgi:hypothetical protein
MSDWLREITEQRQNLRFSTVDGGYTAIPTLDGDAVPRNGVICIRPRRTDGGDEFFTIELGGEAFGRNETDPPLTAGIFLSKTELIPYLNLLREKWAKVINAVRTPPGTFGFLKKSKPFLSGTEIDASVLESEAKDLAIAGADLFNAIFMAGEKKIEELRRHLIDGLSKGPCFLTIYSEGFFAPWGMLYVHPPGKESLDNPDSPAVKEGFLGYQHVIEHATDSYVPTAAIKPTDNLIDFSFTFDAGIDTEQQVRSIQKQRAYFGSLSELRACERASKLDVESAFRKEPFRDQVSYFFVHGLTSDAGSAGTPPRFFIGTDSIEAAEIQQWVNPRKLDSQPFIFFNACQTGQMRSLFYENFALKLLDLHARGLIGPQIDMPTQFAEDYATKFFVEFLKRRDSKEPRVGEIIRTLARKYWDDAHNPLGLAYSLFKGADCYVAW